MPDSDFDETNPTLPSQTETQATQADSASGQVHAPLPTTIGKYSIESLIGQGGMGAVYKAEQDSPRRTVALKVIKAGVASKSLLQRFEIEAQILGKLDHPGIATIYEAGTFDEGKGQQPFFAMEFVQGLELLDYANTNKLGTRDRLALLAKVADAVQHAHQKGIIHRDLKPGNILVNDKGQIKVLDFGVARATDADIQTATMQTDIGQLIGTIPYMSPEQASGNPDDLDTRSDVYALGVIAYELLTGQMPYDLKQKMIHEAVRVIREDEPKTLSAINKTFRGDVEIIVSKALVKEKDRRYQSASDLASDIDRYLNNEPIEARPPSTWYQLSKFSKRNKALVAGIIAVLIVSIAGALISINFAMGEAEQKQLALDAAGEARIAKEAAESAQAEEAKRADELQQVADFQSEQLGLIDVELMGTQLRDSILEGALKDSRPALSESLATVNFTNIALGALEANIFEQTIEAIDTQFADQPLVRAKMLQSTAETLKYLGLNEMVTYPLERALEIRREELGNDHPDTLTSINQLGVLLLDQGKIEKAEQFIGESLHARRQLLGNDHPDTLQSINSMGALLDNQSKLTDAEYYYLEALEGRRRVLGDDHPKTLTSMNNMGYVLFAQGKQTEAKHYFQEAMEKYRQTLGNDHPEALTTISNLGALLRSQGELQEAEPYFREALETRRRVLGDNHPSTLRTIQNLGDLLNRQGRLSEAELLLQEAIDGRRRVLGDYHPDTLRSINSMGDLLNNQGRLSDAESHYLEALEGRRRVLGDNHPNTLFSLNNMGYILHRQSKLTEAEPYLNEALEIRRSTLGDDHPSTLNSIINLGALLRTQDKLDEAEPYFRETLETRRRLLGDTHQSTLTSISNMAILLSDQGRLSEAEKYFREAWAGYRLTEPNGNWLIWNTQSWLGETLAKQSNFVEAEGLLVEAAERIDPPESRANRREEAIQRVVNLYIAWHAAEPGNGYDTKAEEWSGRLGEFD